MRVRSKTHFKGNGERFGPATILKNIKKYNSRIIIEYYNKQQHGRIKINKK